MSNSPDDFEAMDLEKDEGTDNKSCSICLDPVIDHADRSIARLHCGHEFHLDCIGSAFNAKGTMQCPNCRKVEKGRWLFANGHRSSAVDFDFDAWMSSDEFYDFSYSELPFGFQWCPFQGLTQLASLFEEGESQLNSYHEPLSSSTYGDHQNTSNNTHICPYLALHGNPHTMHTAAPSSSTDSENIGFPRQSNVLGLQLPSNNDIMNSHNFPNTEPQNQNWRHAPHSHVFNFLGNAADQSAAQFGPRPSRDTANQPRLGSFVHPRRVVHVSVPVSGSNVLNPTMAEHRSHAPHSHSHSSSSSNNNNNYHMYHQHSVPSSSIRSAQFTHPPLPPAPARRSRPRVAPHIPPPSSSSSSSSSSNEVGGFYSFPTISNSTVPGPHHHPDETMAHHHLYGRGGSRGRERLNPSLPWIPLEGEAQWWGPFNPNSGPQAGGGGSRNENGYQRMPPPGPRMPPPYM